MSNTVSNYLSLVKFSHTIFALPFALIGFTLAVVWADAGFDWLLLVYVVLCMVFARSAAMAFNRYIDRDIDKDNARTAVREIPAGVISPKAALTFVIVNCLAFVGITYLINPICFMLSPVALLVVLGYSLTKRFTFLCHLVLGIGLALAPIGAYLAVTGEFNWMPLFFSFAVLFWVSGFDIIYALQDEGFDKAHALHSIPVRLGTQNSLRLSTVFHIVTAGFIILAGIYADLGLLYWIGAAIFIALLGYQQT